MISKQVLKVSGSSELTVGQEWAHRPRKDVEPTKSGDRGGRIVPIGIKARLRPLWCWRRGSDFENHFTKCLQKRKSFEWLILYFAWTWWLISLLAWMSWLRKLLFETFSLVRETRNNVLRLKFCGDWAKTSYKKSWEWCSKSKACVIKQAPA